VGLGPYTATRARTVRGGPDHRPAVASIGHGTNALRDMVLLAPVMASCLHTAMALLLRQSLDRTCTVHQRRLGFSAPVTLVISNDVSCESEQGFFCSRDHCACDFK
jgi:hypothetical protein